jgi:hypothetical protein
MFAITVPWKPLRSVQDMIAGYHAPEAIYIPNIDNLISDMVRSGVEILGK